MDDATRETPVFQATLEAVQRTISRITADVIRMEVWLVGDPPAAAPDANEAALTALRQHVHAESAAFAADANQLMAVLQSAWKATDTAVDGSASNSASNSASTGDPDALASSDPPVAVPPLVRTRQRHLTVCAQLLLRCAVCALQKSGWGARVTSVDPDTLLGFCVHGHDWVVERPTLRARLQAVSDWMHGHHGAVAAACVAVGAVAGAATYLSAPPSTGRASKSRAAASGGKPLRALARSAVAAATTACTAVATALGVETLGSSVALRLTTKFIQFFERLCGEVARASAKHLDLPQLVSSLETAVRLSEMYVVFLDCVGANVPSLSELTPLVAVQDETDGGVGVGVGVDHHTAASDPTAALDVSTSFVPALDRLRQRHAAGGGLALPTASRSSASVGTGAGTGAGAGVAASSTSSACDPLAGSFSSSRSGVFHLHPAVRGSSGKVAQCVICLCPLTPRDVLVRSSDETCGKFHAFHASCLRTYDAVEGGCPVCRRRFDSMSRFRIPTPFVPSADAWRLRPHASTAT